MDDKSRMFRGSCACETFRRNHPQESSVQCDILADRKKLVTSLAAVLKLWMFQSDVSFATTADRK